MMAILIIKTITRKQGVISDYESNKERGFLIHISPLMYHDHFGCSLRALS